jgi:hypothetical protein
MPANINTFFNLASQRQFARDFFMRVKQIKLPGLSLDGETDLVFAKTASIPGRDIEDKTVNYSGQTFHLNGKSSYPGSEGYSIEFYHTQDLDLRKKLEKASRTAFDNETTTGQMCMPGPESYIMLDLLGVPCGQGNSGGQGFEVLDEIKLVGVSIRNIGDIAYQIADGTGEILSLPCTFSYHFYENFAK